MSGEYAINVDLKIATAVYPPRRVPIDLRDKFKIELNLLVNQGIITPVTKNNLIGQLTCLCHKGSVRLCLDPKETEQGHTATTFYDPRIQKRGLNVTWCKMVLDRRCQIWLQANETQQEIKGIDNIYHPI